MLPESGRSAAVWEGWTQTNAETMLLRLFGFQAHLRRHVQVHKRTENYSPRQRKLRNVVVQEVDVDPSEHQPPEEAEALEDRGCVPGTLREPHPDGADPRQVVLEEVVSNQELRGDAAAESFSVSEVLQQTQLVHSFGSSVQVEMVPSRSGSKS